MLFLVPGSLIIRSMFPVAQGGLPCAFTCNMRLSASESVGVESAIFPLLMRVLVEGGRAAAEVTAFISGISRRIALPCVRLRHIIIVLACVAWSCHRGLSNGFLFE